MSFAKRKREVNGETMKLVSYVKGPENTSKRWDPPLMKIMCGTELRSGLRTISGRSVVARKEYQLLALG